MDEHFCDVCGAPGTVIMWGDGADTIYYCEACSAEEARMNADDDNDDWRDKDCPHCSGTGWYIDAPCDFCDGEGYLWWL